MSLTYLLPCRSSPLDIWTVRRTRQVPRRTTKADLWSLSCFPYRSHLCFAGCRRLWQIPPQSCSPLRHLDRLYEGCLYRNPSHIFTDGFLTIEAPLLDTLSLSTTELTTHFARAATGIYLSPSAIAPAVTFLIRTPKSQETSAYYHELLGVSVAVLLSTFTPLQAFFQHCNSSPSTPVNQRE